MNNHSQILEIVDENENVVGLESRDDIHQKGLLHREIHIWFVTPAGEIIFQHRGKDKDTHPDQLDSTVGGHVEPNMSYEEAAGKECKEETGIDIDIKDLVLLGKIRKSSLDESTGMTNNVFRNEYAYLYSGKIDDLRVEEGEAQGFEVWKIEALPNLSEEDKKRFVPMVVSENMLALIDKAKNLLN